MRGEKRKKGQRRVTFLTEKNAGGELNEQEIDKQDKRSFPREAICRCTPGGRRVLSKRKEGKENETRQIRRSEHRSKRRTKREIRRLTALQNPTTFLLLVISQTNHAPIGRILQQLFLLAPTLHHRSLDDLQPRVGDRLGTRRRRFDLTHEFCESPEIVVIEGSSEETRSREEGVIRRVESSNDPEDEGSSSCSFTGRLSGGFLLGTVLSSSSISNASHRLTKSTEVRS